LHNGDKNISPAASELFRTATSAQIRHSLFTTAFPKPAGFTFHMYLFFIHFFGSAAEATAHWRTLVVTQQ